MRWVFACWLACIATAHAGQLPVRVYTTADGLANNSVDDCASDTRGFLWFATIDGVSWFDGHRFESYGTADGLPAMSANAVLGARDGRVWVATEGGLGYFDPREPAVRPHLHVVLAAATRALVEDADGVVWAGTADGLARIAGGAVATEPLVGVRALAYDAVDRSLWIGTRDGLAHRDAAGHLARWRFAPPGELDDRVFSLLVDRDRRLWIGHVSPRLLVARLPLSEGSTPLWERSELQHFTVEGALRRTIRQDARGDIWIGTTAGLHRFANGTVERVEPDRLGAYLALTACTEDSSGNLWFASETRGVLRMAPRGMLAYGPSDGLDPTFVNGLYEAADGTLYVVTNRGGQWLARRDGERFTAVFPKLPDGIVARGWGRGQVVALDREQRWWYATGHGVARYPRVARLEDLATTEPRIYDKRDGLPGNDVYRIYEDRRGTVWISTAGEGATARWDRATDRFAVQPELPHAAALAFAETPDGALWIGFEGKLARIRGGVTDVFGAEHGVPGGPIHGLLVDRAGRLWLSSEEQGIGRIDDPRAAVPAIRRYRAADGLRSDISIALTEDLHGRIYVGTTAGIARLDPETGEIGHFGVEDGLPNDFVQAALRTRDGALWFGTKSGVARYVPSDDPPAPPPTYITHVAVAGVPIAFDGTPLELDPDGASLDVELSSPRFQLGAPLRFQYRLGDAWSLPFAEHTLHFARLAPGSYRLEVRAVDGGAPAILELVVLRPIWQRWWFVTSALVLVAGIAYIAYRWRVAHVLAVERVRTRIATDLHDELGSSLSRIAILSELASRRAASREDIGAQVGQIGANARELVDVAADIVWSTDPKRDDLGSLLVRLRAFAGDVLDARGIAWAIDAPAHPDRVKLSPDQRRHLYLVLKEAIHNAAKHSGATRVDVTLRAERGIVATVSDDGRGFDERALARRGNGLANMRARAREAGGTLAIRARPGGGTEIELRMA